VPHAGATLPVLASRIDLFALRTGAQRGRGASLREARTRCTSTWPAHRVKEQLAALLSVSRLTRMHYAATFRGRRGRHAVPRRSSLETSGQLDDAALDAMFRATPEGLFRQAATFGRDPQTFGLPTSRYSSVAASDPCIPC